MKFLPLIWAGISRRPARSVLTSFSIVVAFLLLGLLEGVNAGFEKAISESHREFLVTNTRVRGGTPMPIASLEKIRAIPGVKEVTLRTYFIGIFGGIDPRNGVAAIATEPEVWFHVRPKFTASRDHLDAMNRDRAGLLATPPLLKQFGWKIGDTVTLRSKILKSDGTGDWTFHVVGIFDTRDEPSNAGFGLIHYAYVDESRIENRNTAEMFYTRIADPNKAMATAQAIDRLFANSAHETSTHSDEQRAESRAKQLGDIELFTDAVMGAVLFTLLFLTANTLRQSLHERRAEFGVLKSVGFGDASIFLLAVSEALLLCVPPALIGLLLARIVAPLAKNDFGAVVVSSKVALIGFFCATVVALISVALPAWTLARSSISESLGRK